MRKNFNHRAFRFPLLKFWTGAACVLSLGGTFAPRISHLHGYARSPEEVDTRALASDWATIGKDCITVLNKLGEEEIHSTATA